MSGVDRLLSGLSGPQRLLAFLAVLLAVSLLLAFQSGGLPAMLLVLLGIILLLWITRSIWLAPDQDGTRMRLASLSAVLAVATLVAAGPQIEVLLAALTAQGLIGAVPDWLLGLLQMDRFTAIALMAFTLVGVFIVNWLARDTSTMKQHPTPLEEEFPERRYREKRDQFCEILRSHLRDLNLKTRWSEAHFTPLDAEVEVRSQGQSKRRLTDLMTALRSDHRSRVFLVLGDPGSGKSVALRTLAMQLLDEVTRADRVPIYINLKEWEADTPWTEAHPPTVAALHDFILANLKERSDVFCAEFLDIYFKRMLENGRFFILLDSFDEIPCVLDVPESSWLIERLSQVISTFLAGATETRGVLASRLFRRPTLTLDDGATLEIRPFDEARIARTLKNSEYVDDQLVQHLFRERPELVPIARNPFTAALIQAYATETRGQLPDNQLQLFQSYIGTRLKAAGERLATAGLTEQQVIDACTDIAWTMFEDPELGLEAPLSRLEAKLPDHQVRTVVKLLSFTRLIRLGGADQERISFVHRRFNEYFVAQGLIRHPERIRLQTIPTDSQWRDALVLYCEVSDVSQATAIANFCWEEVRGLADGTIDHAHPAYLRSVHSLRFLRDAFRARPECLSKFGDQLEKLLAEEVALRHGLLAAKIALEATGLLKLEHIEPIVVAALNADDPWLSDTALRACRHLPQLGEDLEDKLETYINSLPYRALSARHKELLFSLRLSDAFSYLYRFTKLKWLDTRLLLIAFVMLAVAYPRLFGAILLLAALSWLSVLFNRSISKSRPWRSRKVHNTKQMVAWPILSRYMERFLFGGAQIKLTHWLRLSALCITATFSLALLFPAQQGHLDGANSQFWNEIATFSFLGSCRVVFPADSCRYAAVFLLLTIVSLLVPWYEISRLRRTAARLFAVIRSAWSELATLAIASAILIGTGYLLGRSNFLSGLGLKLVGGLIVVVVFLRVSTITLIRAQRHLRDWLQDFHQLRAFRQSPITERGRIESELSVLKTARARRRYVERLSEQRIKPTGTWSQGLPYLANDPASTRLAQLEERWLGLADR